MEVVCKNKPMEGLNNLTAQFVAFHDYLVCSRKSHFAEIVHGSIKEKGRVWDNKNVSVRMQPFSLCAHVRIASSSSWARDCILYNSFVCKHTVRRGYTCGNKNTSFIHAKRRHLET